MNNNKYKWDKRFLTLCERIAQWSKDPSTKCGAIIVRPDKTIASVGYNGFPRGMSDDPSLYADRPTKYSRVVHAELNAIFNCNEPVRGYTLYSTPFMPCDRCAIHLIQAGISVVVGIMPPQEFKDRHSIDKSYSYFEEAGVEVRMY